MTIFPVNRVGIPEKSLPDDLTDMKIESGSFTGVVVEDPFPENSNAKHVFCCGKSNKKLRIAIPRGKNIKVLKGA
jgi:hypothetical protein